MRELNKTTTEERVFLRPFEPGDIDAMFAVRSDPRVRANIIGHGWTPSRSEHEQWFNAIRVDQSSRRLAVVDGRNEVLGMAGLWRLDLHNRHAEAGIMLGGANGESIRNRGAGTSSVQSLMRIAFQEIGLVRLHAQILTHNTPSLAVFERKCGWRREGLLRQHVWRDGDFRDVVQLGILREDFILRERP